MKAKKSEEVTRKISSEEGSLFPTQASQSSLLLAAGTGRQSRTEELEEACRMAREQLSQATKKTEPPRITMTIPQHVDTWDAGLQDGQVVGSEESLFSEASEEKYPRRGLKSSLETAIVTYFTKNVISNGFHDLEAEVRAKRDQLGPDDPPDDPPNGSQTSGQAARLRRSASF